MIRNLWKNIHFLCGNHGEEIAMEYHVEEHPFFMW